MKRNLLVISLLISLLLTLPVHSARHVSTTNVAHMTVTAYHSHHCTATGTRPHRGMCAASRGLLGRRIHVQGVGWLVVEDICPRRGVIDVWMPSKAHCRRWGRRVVKVRMR